MPSFKPIRSLGAPGEAALAVEQLTLTNHAHLTRGKIIKRVSL